MIPLISRQSNIKAGMQKRVLYNLVDKVLKREFCTDIYKVAYGIVTTEVWHLIMVNCLFSLTYKYDSYIRFGMFAHSEYDPFVSMSKIALCSLLSPWYAHGRRYSVFYDVAVTAGPARSAYVAMISEITKNLAQLLKIAEITDHHRVWVKVFPGWFQSAHIRKNNDIHLSWNFLTPNEESVVTVKIKVLFKQFSQ